MYSWGIKKSIETPTALCLGAYFESNGKHRINMIAHANRGQTEAIGNFALNLLRGNIILPISSFLIEATNAKAQLSLIGKKPILK